MTVDRPRPRIVVSKCMEFERCRYNGEMINSEFIKRLRPYADMVPVCMEVEIGLGVPRDPVRVVQIEGEQRLVQPATGMDVTEKARSFTDAYLSELSEIDGFILKGRSPSCGIKDVKVYPPGTKVAVLTAKGSGFFARGVVERFGHLAIEDESRLLNLRIGEHFLTKVFALAELRGVMKKGRISDLVDFHSRYKLLLMHYNQKELGSLGNIVANRSKRSIADVLTEYEGHFRSALARPPRCGSGVNVMLHAFGYFSEDLNPKERSLFIDSLKRYTDGKVPFTVPLGMLQSWVERFDQSYLRQQRFLQPFPDEFLELMSNDACVGRDLWSK